MLKKYILQGGYIGSKKDGDWHYISANQLQQLYKVNPIDCVYMDKEDIPQKAYGLPKDIITLIPRYHGDYNLPK